MVTNQIIPTAFFGLKDFLNTFAADNASATERVPAAALYEREQGYELEVELPGVKKEDVDVHIENNMLTVAASRKRGEQVCSYKREFRVSEEVDQENVKAAFENGLLKLEIQKRQQPTAKKINIL